MNRRLIAVFGFALAVAGVTSFLVYRLIMLRMQAPPRPIPSNKVIVAAHDLQVGELIRDRDLSEVSWTGPVPQQAMRSRDELVGRGVIAPIYKNELIEERRLASKGAGAGLAATIPLGKRAVALRIDDVVGLAGFVVPGMRVDVLVAGNAPGMDGGRTGTLCRTVLQNIEVLSAGQRLEKNVDGKPQSAQVVNLLVTPDQAEVLNLAGSETKVQLVLRNPLDTEEQKTAGASMAGLFGAGQKRAAPAPAVIAPVAQHIAKPLVQEPDVATVEVFTGTKKSEQIVGLAEGSPR